MKRGHGMEFSDYRNYMPGDNPRYIDWSIFARSDRVYVKQFQEEQDLPVFLLLDGSPSMHYPEDNRKWQYAMQIAASLAYIGLMQHDSIRVSVPGAFYSPAYTGARAFYRLIGDLEAVAPVTNQDLFQEHIQRAVSHFRFPGLCFFLSDFLMPVEHIRKVLDVLRAKNLDICCIQILGKDDIQPASDLDSAELVDSETGESFHLSLDKNIREEYSYYLSQHNGELKAMCEEYGILYQLAYPENSIESFVFENLTQTGLIR